MDRVQSLPSEVTEVLLAPSLYEKIVAHARRKLQGVYLDHEERERKAFGLLGARLSGSRAVVTHVFPLVANLRYAPVHRAEFDSLAEQYAIPSETPSSRRGWLADPMEVMRADDEFRRTDSVLFGAYHMHRVAWSNDAIRDRCTGLDRHLAENSGIWVFVLSMVDQDHPVLRGFFEADNSNEIRVLDAEVGSGASPRPV